MATKRKVETRALSADEREIVGQTSAAAMKSLTDSELISLVKLTRARRDRAKTVAQRQRREIRGKAAARGAALVKADGGSRLKLSVLSTALERLTAETDRRRRASAKKSLVASAKKALAAKKAAKPAAPPSGESGANKGLRGKARITVENHVPKSTRGRVRKQVARAQAKRDARPR